MERDREGGGRDIDRQKKKHKELQRRRRCVCVWGGEGGVKRVCAHADVLTCVCIKGSREGE